MNEALKMINETGVVPVVVIENIKDAEPLAEALMDGGLFCAEVTFRTEAARETIKRINDKYEDIFCGAGTVRSIEQVKMAIDAGARFIVSPGFNPNVVQYCVKNGITVIPGVQTPTEIEAAVSEGLKVLKFFPAEQAGGIKMLRALGGPYPEVSFIPTGGISASNLSEYLSYEKVFACGGSWMVSKELIRSGNFKEIRRLSSEAVQIVREVRG